MNNGKKQRNRWLVTALCLALTTGLLSACSGNANPEGPANTPGTNNGAGGSGLAPVELTWYYPEPMAQTDLRLVNDEVNKILTSKINATIRLLPVDFGGYEQKLNTVAASNETVDIIWTSNWLFNWVDNQSKGAFIPLDDLLEEHGQELYQSMPDFFWDDVKIRGEIYGVPGYQIAAKRPGFVVQKELADRYNLDVDAIKSVEDIEPFLLQIKENEPDLTPFGTAGGWFDPLYYGFDPVVSVYRGDSTHQVVDTAFSPEYEQYLNMMHSWYTQGLINPDAAVKGEISGTQNAQMAVMWDWTLKPGGEAEAQANNGGVEVIYIPLTESHFTGSSSTMNAISRTSPNPERAMMFLQLLNTDPELYNLMTYGIEDVHYTKLSDQFIRLTPDSGYMPTTDWVFGNITNGYLLEGAPEDKFDLTAEVNENAEVSPYYGFEFDPEPVKTELANAEAVHQEYAAGLNTGTLDPAQYLTEYREKLKQSGADRVLEETQRQLDAWLAEQGQ